MIQLAPRSNLVPFPIQPSSALQLVAARFGGRLGLPDKRFDVRIEIPSGSVELQNYVVARDRKSQRWSCGCKGWIFCRKCYHLSGMVPYLEAALELQELALPAEAGVWYSGSGERFTE